ncbi:MAG: sugar ABC transporter permease [Oscillospiraceae bacterium]|nr:sugar ABC transporter permease [Oscillospiraceae bacterium]
MKNNRFVAIVLVPALTLLTLFVIIPIMGSFFFSLFDYNPLRNQNHFLGLGNYARLLQDSTYIKSFQNTLIFVFVTVAINIALTLVLGQFISGVKRRWLRNLFLVAIFLPCVAPVANSAVVWSRSMYPTKGGLINVLLMALDITPVNWVGSPLMLMPALIIFTIWVDIGYNTVLFTAGIDGIPKDFYEAADIDGAGHIIRFFKITLPLLGRTFSFVTAMTIISHFQMFAQFEIMARDGGPGKAGQVLTTYIYYSGFKAKDMGYASAISVTLFLLILAVTLVQQRLNRVDWGY